MTFDVEAACHPPSEQSSQNTIRFFYNSSLQKAVSSPTKSAVIYYYSTSKVPLLTLMEWNEIWDNV